LQAVGCRNKIRGDRVCDGKSGGRSAGKLNLEQNTRNRVTLKRATCVSEVRRGVAHARAKGMSEFLKQIHDKIF
jgi:hypothetical protein